MTPKAKTADRTQKSTGSKIELLHIFISPGHNFFRRHGKPAAKYAAIETQVADCVAGSGIKGDRFFDFKKRYKGQITFFAWEVYQELCDRMGVSDKDPSVFRRNIITRGIDLNTLIGKEFEIQGVKFLGTAECTPCYWMNQAFAPGAEEALKGRGGLRAKIVSDGVLTVTKKPVRSTKSRSKQS
jgi:MOSC domain-containing protein YiiM